MNVTLPIETVEMLIEAGKSGVRQMNRRIIQGDSSISPEAAEALAEAVMTADLKVAIAKHEEKEHAV